MSAAYDSYDYPSYWHGREYEHNSEVYALRSLLNKIPEISTVLDIGAGYGRLTPVYSYRAKRIILTDPSLRLLNLAKRKIKRKNTIFMQSSVENLNNKLSRYEIDLIVFIRVMHHIKDLDKALSVISELSHKNSHLILEFPNKTNLKATLRQIFKGNITFPIDIFPKDLRSKRSIEKNALPFVNYHPDFILEKLKEYNFKIVDIKSVSNIRSTYLKKNLPLELLMSVEKFFQTYLKRMIIGPSIFILAKKI